MVFLDSSNAIRWVSKLDVGKPWRLQNKFLCYLFSLVRRRQSVTLMHIIREGNVLVDQLSKSSLDRHPEFFSGYNILTLFYLL